MGWWKEAVNVFNFASGNWDKFSSTVDTIPSSYWDPLWGFCNGNGDAEVTSAELTECGAKAAAWAGISDSTQTFLYNFAAKYWSTVDQNGSGSLDYDEFRYTLAGSPLSMLVSSLLVSMVIAMVFSTLVN